MKNLNETLRILSGSKQYNFGYNDNGEMSVLNVTDYNTGETVSLDLSRLTDEMLAELQYEPESEDFDDFEY